MFSAPIDLSGLPTYRDPVRDRPARTAFLGRCSTKDNQDPRSSIAGQVAEASLLLPPGQEFTGYYWDVESGMLGLADRSRITEEDYAALGVPVRRDGGVTDLLDAVERGEIDRVATERISRSPARCGRAWTWRHSSKAVACRWMPPMNRVRAE
jgi:hypothetical protein